MIGNVYYLLALSEALLELVVWLVFSSWTLQQGRLLLEDSQP